jgi:hypothetical protein
MLLVCEKQSANSSRLSNNLLYPVKVPRKPETKQTIAAYNIPMRRIQ